MDGVNDHLKDSDVVYGIVALSVAAPDIVLCTTVAVAKHVSETVRSTVIVGLIDVIEML